MSKEDLTARDFVVHILQAADRILDYTKGMSREEFLVDSFKQDAVIRNIDILGEAAICARSDHQTSIKRIVMAD